MKVLADKEFSKNLNFVVSLFPKKPIHEVFQSIKIEAELDNTITFTCTDGANTTVRTAFHGNVKEAGSIILNGKNLHTVLGGRVCELHGKELIAGICNCIITEYPAENWPVINSEEKILELQEDRDSKLEELMVAVSAKDLLEMLKKATKIVKKAFLPGRRQILLNLIETNENQALKVFACDNYLLMGGAIKPLIAYKPEKVRLNPDSITPLIKYLESICRSKKTCNTEVWIFCSEEDGTKYVTFQCNKFWLGTESYDEKFSVADYEGIFKTELDESLEINRKVLLDIVMTMKLAKAANFYTIINFKWVSDKDILISIEGSVAESPNKEILLPGNYQRFNKFGIGVLALTQAVENLTENRIVLRMAEDQRLVLVETANPKEKYIVVKAGS